MINNIFLCLDCSKLSAAWFMLGRQVVVAAKYSKKLWKVCCCCCDWVVENNRQIFFLHVTLFCVRKKQVCSKRTMWKCVFRIKNCKFVIFENHFWNRSPIPILWYVLCCAPNTNLIPSHPNHSNRKFKFYVIHLQLRKRIWKFKNINKIISNHIRTPIFVFASSSIIVFHLAFQFKSIS